MGAQPPTAPVRPARLQAQPLPLCIDCKAGMLPDCHASWLHMNDDHACIRYTVMQPHGACCGLHRVGVAQGCVQ